MDSRREVRTWKQKLRGRLGRNRDKSGTANFLRSRSAEREKRGYRREKTSEFERQPKRRQMVLIRPKTCQRRMTSIREPSSLTIEATLDPTRAN